MFYTNNQRSIFGVLLFFFFLIEISHAICPKIHSVNYEWRTSGDNNELFMRI